MKQTLALIAALALLSGLAACSGRGGGEEKTTLETPAPTEQMQAATSREALTEYDPDGDVKRCDFLNAFLGAVVSPDLAEMGLFDFAGTITRDSAVELAVSALKLPETPVWLAFKGKSNLTNAECAAMIDSITENVVNKNKEPLEIERKFLINAADLPFDRAKSTPYAFVQTYVSLSPEVRVRQINGSEHWFTVKLPKDEIGLARQEVEFTITAEEYQSLVEKREGSTIHKTRYIALLGGYRVAVDIYSEALAGLAVAEIQFENVEEANEFKPFKWFLKDVTSDKRYKNASLAVNGLPE